MKKKPVFFFVKSGLAILLTLLLFSCDLFNGTKAGDLEVLKLQKYLNCEYYWSESPYLEYPTCFGYDEACSSFYFDDKVFVTWSGNSFTYYDRRLAYDDVYEYIEVTGTLSADGKEIISATIEVDDGLRLQIYELENIPFSYNKKVNNKNLYAFQMTTPNLIQYTNDGEIQSTHEFRGEIRFWSYQ